MEDNIFGCLRDRYVPEMAGHLSGLPHEGQPAPRNAPAGFPLSYHGAETWSPTQNFLCPGLARTRARGALPSTIISSTRLARRPGGKPVTPPTGRNGTTTWGCCNERNAYAPRTWARPSGRTSARAVSGRRQGKCGGPARPSTPCPRCHPVCGHREP